MKVKLHQLESLVALVDGGSIRAAARLLSITQPTLSARIVELEHALGTTLVHRSVHGATLTAAGRTLLAHARIIDNEVKRAVEEVERTTSGGHTTLTIGCSALATIEVVAPVVEEFRARYPATTLNLVDGLFQKLAVSLREGFLDMVVGPLPVTRPYQKVLQFEELVTYPMLVVGRAGNPFRGARRLEALRDAQWIVGASTSERQATVEELFQQYRMPKPHIAVRTDSITQVQSILAASDLLGLLTVQLFAGIPGRPIVAVPIEEEIKPVRVGLITRKGSVLAPASKALADMLRKQARTAAAAVASRRRPVAKT